MYAKYTLNAEVFWLEMGYDGVSKDSKFYKDIKMQMYPSEKMFQK